MTGEQIIRRISSLRIGIEMQKGNSLFLSSDLGLPIVFTVEPTMVSYLEH